MHTFIQICWLIVIVCNLVTFYNFCKMTKLNREIRQTREKIAELERRRKS